jgi:hypothetical protein
MPAKINQAGMACQEKTLKLICAQEKSFITLARAANIINFF